MKIAKTVLATIAVSSAAFAAATDKPVYSGLSKNKIVEIVQPKPTPTLPGEPARCWLEVGAFGGLANQDINGAYPRASAQTGGPYNFFEDLDNPGVGEINIVGAEITAGYDLTDLVAITFNIGYGYGSASNTGLILGDLPYRERASLHTFTFMPGLRFSHDLSHQWTLFAGLAAGISNESVKYKITDPEYGMQRSHNSEWGFVYSVQIGAQYHFTKCMYAYAAYEFRGNMAEPVLIHQAPVDARAQTYHMIRVGLGFKF